MAGSYTHTLFSTFITQLAEDMGDTAKVHFTDPELTIAAKEAIQVFNLLTGYYRAARTFTTTANLPWYDLRSKFPAELGITTTVRDLVTAIQYRLMEHGSSGPDPITGTGMTEMFSFSELVRSIQQRHDRYLGDSQINVVGQSALPVPAGTGQVQLDEATVSVVRAVWQANSGRGRSYNLIPPSDEAGATSMLSPSLAASWRQNPGIPSTWSITTSPNLRLQLIPPPIEDGTLTLWTAVSGPVLSTTAPPAGTILSVPNDLAWGIGWGAMEDLLLKDGIGHDPARAEFCAGQYALAVEIGRSLPVVLSVAINNVMCPVGQASTLDSMRNGWQGHTTDTPTTAVVLSGNLLGLYPVPDDEYSVEVTMVQSAPVLTTITSLQLGREQLSAIRAWAKQLLLFKSQGVQLQQGQLAAGALIQAARVYNEDRIAGSSYLSELMSTSYDRTRVLPRTAEAISAPDTDPRDTANTRQSRNADANYKRPYRRLGGQ